MHRALVLRARDTAEYEVNKSPCAHAVYILAGERERDPIDLLISFPDISDIPILVHKLIKTRNLREPVLLHSPFNWSPSLNSTPKSFS